MMAFSNVVQEGKLTLGLVFPIEAYSGAIPAMQDQEQRAKQAEQLGFKALWFRDVPFHDPTFGDVGQIYDPWVYMTHIMNQTQHIALATGSVILPLRHPIHTFKSLSSIQALSGGRVLMGIASGDRPDEYPAFQRDLAEKGELFRDSFFYLKALQGNFPHYDSKNYGKLEGKLDLIPKDPFSTPMFVTGHSGQSVDWIAKHADGWLYYPRNMQFLEHTMQQWKDALEQQQLPWKPYMQSLYIDLTKDDFEHPRPIHLGFRCGPEYLLHFLKGLEERGVNHVIINLKYSSRPAVEIVEELGEKILPHFEVATNQNA